MNYVARVSDKAYIDMAVRARYDKVTFGIFPPPMSYGVGVIFF